MHPEHDLTADAMINLDSGHRLWVDEDAYVAFAEGMRSSFVLVDQRWRRGALVQVMLDADARPLSDDAPAPDPLLFMITDVHVPANTVVLYSLRPVELRFAL